MNGSKNGVNGLFISHFIYINYQVELVCKRRQSFAQIIHWCSATRINDQYSAKYKIEIKLMHGGTNNSHSICFVFSVLIVIQNLFAHTRCEQKTNSD